jgi:hypothetical protein
MSVRKWIEGQDMARFRYYAGSLASWILPDGLFRLRRAKWEALLRQSEDADLFHRAWYYNQLRETFQTHDLVGAPSLPGLFSGRSAYQLDLHAGTRCFPVAWGVSACLGDNRDIPPYPQIVKSRPIGPENANAVLLNLNKVRHFYFVHDPCVYRAKRDLIVWRGRACQANRKAFLAQYYNHPLCDVGHYHRKHQDVVWTKPELSVHEQLRYKFILSIEGNDVATNLKWILSSQSLCFMAKPRFETWFMEGQLVPGRHYVALADDFSDLEEKVEHYLHHPEEAEDMILEANRWVARFRDPLRERLIMILVLWRYFYLSGQCAEPPPGFL